MNPTRIETEYLPMALPADGAEATWPESPVYRLENWVLETTGSPYQPPEQRARILTGHVYGHRNFSDGHHIRTSELTGTAGRLVTTLSGSIYSLGVVDRDYYAWVMENCPGEWDANNPIRLARAFND